MRVPSGPRTRPGHRRRVRLFRRTTTGMPPPGWLPGLPPDNSHPGCSGAPCHGRSPCPPDNRWPTEAVAPKVVPPSPLPVRTVWKHPTPSWMPSLRRNSVSGSRRGRGVRRLQIICLRPAHGTGNPTVRGASARWRCRNGVPKANWQRK